MAARGEEVKGLAKNLLDFVDFLRQGGLKVSNAEAIDALEGLRQHIDWTKKTEVKSALCCFLVKNPHDLPIFHSLFDLYFQPLKKRQAQLDKLQQNKEEEDVIAAEQSLFTQAWALPTHTLFVTRRQLLPPDAMKTYTKLPATLKKEIKLQLNRAVVQGEDLGVVSAEIIQFLQKWEAEQMAKGLERPWGQVVGDLAPVSQNLRNQDLGKLKPIEIEQMQLYIEKLGKKLATLLANRLKITAQQKKINLRKTIRKNLGSGGVIFNLVYQTKKINKPKITLFCDVSGSMANYSLFTLQLLYGMQQAMEKMESFLFGTDLERITHYLDEKNKDFTEISRLIKENSYQWRGGTALGSSMNSFFRRWSSTVNDKTTVIIISDGATRDQEAALVYLERLKEQAKSLLWLNPKPKGEWATCASKVFQEYFPMFECRNVQQLEKAVTDEFFH